MAAVIWFFSSFFFMQRVDSLIFGRASCRWPLVVSCWLKTSREFHCKRQLLATFSTVCDDPKAGWRMTEDHRLTSLIKPHFPDVLRDGGIHKTCEWFSRGCGFSNRGGRNWLIYVV